MMDKLLLSMAEVCACTSLSEPSIRRMFARGDFPNPVRVSDNRVAWRVDDVAAWVKGLPDALSDGQGAARASERA